MITGARAHGAVKHYGHTHVSLCGRYMVPGKGENLRDCRSCVRIGKLVTDGNASELEMLAAQRYGGNVAMVREVIAKPRSASQLMFLREILASTEEDGLDPAWRALCMLWEAKWSGKAVPDMGMFRDPKRAQRGNGNGGMIDPKNARPARKPRCGASPAQSAWMLRMVAEINEAEITEKYTEAFLSEIPWKEMDKHIEFLKGLVNVTRNEARKATEAPKGEAITQGMYKVGDDIYKVKPTQAGKLWAHKLTGSTEDGWEFQFAGNPSRFVKADQKMTLEEAKRFGQITGTCCVCSRMLTDEHSIAEGIGPVCAEKF